MEDELMFSMEEEEGSAKRPPVQSAAPIHRASSLCDASATDDDDDDDHFICPILDDSAKDICHYLKNLVNNRQLSNSLPKSSFTYQVSHGTRCNTNAKFQQIIKKNKTKQTLAENQFASSLLCCLVVKSPAVFCENSCLPYKERPLCVCLQSMNAACVYWSAYVVGYLLTVPLLITGSSPALYTSCEYVGCKHNFDCPRSHNKAHHSEQNVPGQSHCCWPASCRDECLFCCVWFLFKGVMSEMLPFGFADEKPCIFFTFRTKQRQSQNLGPTRFCLRAHGYVTDQLICLYSLASHVTTSASLHPHLFCFF